MTYHRTGGEGGNARNRDLPLPNHNKRAGSGMRRRGKMVVHPKVKRDPAWTKGR